MNINVMLKYNFDDETLVGYVNANARGFKVQPINDELIRVDLYAFDDLKDTYWDGADPFHSFVIEVPDGDSVEARFWAIHYIVQDYRRSLEQQPAEQQPASTNHPIQLMVEHQRSVRRSISGARRSDRLRALDAERLGTRDMREFRRWVVDRQRKGVKQWGSLSLG